MANDIYLVDSKNPAFPALDDILVYINGTGSSNIYPRTQEEVNAAYKQGLLWCAFNDSGDIIASTAAYPKPGDAQHAIELGSSFVDESVRHLGIFPLLHQIRIASIAHRLAETEALKAISPKIATGMPAALSPEHPFVYATTDNAKVVELYKRFLL